MEFFYVSRQNFRCDLTECGLGWQSESSTGSKHRDIENILHPPDKQEQSHSNAKLSEKFQLCLWGYLFYCTDCFGYVLIGSYNYTEMPFKEQIMGLFDLEIKPICVEN
jgi:hypothetical protein